MSLARLARLAAATPPHRLPDRAAVWFGRKAFDQLRRLRDIHRATAGPTEPPLPPGPLATVKPPLTIDGEIATLLVDHYLAHRFDLLGSGWVNAGYGGEARGVEGHRYPPQPIPSPPDREGLWLDALLRPAHRAHARRVWRLVDHDYRPIDWQRDLKSGYRWDSRHWYRDQRYGLAPGADIKLPWELARAHHLPQLALIANHRPEQAPRLAREFRNQLLDFIATNPPRMGVNWCCTMDVAIRAANWLVAHDLFQATGYLFDPDFEGLFAAAIRSHGRHIIANLEWSPIIRANHYLADIAGLLFIAAYLPGDVESDGWLSFAVRELIAESKLQFHPEGSNFEASTSYHRLSAEMVLYATALTLGLPAQRQAALRRHHRRQRGQPGPTPVPLPHHPLPGGGDTPFPAGHFQRLAGMAAFTAAITKPDGRVVQIGDNDSGRFFKLQPAYRLLDTEEAGRHYSDSSPANGGYRPYEDSLDHRHLPVALSGLLAERPEGGEGVLVVALAGGIRMTVDAPVRPSMTNRDALAAAVALSEHHPRDTLDIPLPEGWDDGLSAEAFPDFGLFVLRSQRLHLAVRCGPIGQRGHGGHAHNDQLTVELTIDGEERLRDPGSYLYTPLPTRRDEYRSVHAHFAPRLAEREPGRLGPGLFQLGDEAHAECLHFAADGFAGRHFGYGEPTYRLVLPKTRSLRIIDFHTGPPPLLPMAQHTPPRFSAGYGLRDA